MSKIKPFDKKYTKLIGKKGFTFHCPGCDVSHAIYTKGGKCVWEFNGSLSNPTVSPSLLLYNPGEPSKGRCHSFIRNGQIQFLNDCTHDLAGQTVDMEEVIK